MKKFAMLSGFIASALAAIAFSSAAVAGPQAFQDIVYYSDAAHTVQVGHLEVIDCTGATRMTGTRSAYAVVSTVNYSQCNPGSDS